MVTAFLAAAAVLSASFTFADRTPEQLVEEFVGYCLKDGRVVEMTDRQLTCELNLTRTQKANRLFMSFRQRNYTDQVRHIVTFTAIPAGSGSIGAMSERVEAQIGAQTRVVNLDMNRRDASTVVMVNMGGTRN